MTQEIIGYWFAASERLPHGDGRRVVIGETLRVKPPLELCRRGLHGSEHPWDALRYANGSLLYKCRFSGEILRGDDKLCASERTALSGIDLTNGLREFARQQALAVIHLWPSAPEVLRKYLESGDQNLCAAAYCAAADAKAGAAADAVWSAVWSAAADAAWAAAADAAWAAAAAAVGAAAAAAVGAVAWTAALAAARAAAADSSRVAWVAGTDAAAWAATADAEGAAWRAAWAAAGASFFERVQRELRSA